MSDDIIKDWYGPQMEYIISQTGATPIKLLETYETENEDEVHGADLFLLDNGKYAVVRTCIIDLWDLPPSGPDVETYEVGVYDEYDALSDVETYEVEVYDEYRDAISAYRQAVNVEREHV